MKFKSNNDHHHHNRHTYLFLAVALCCLLLIEQVHGQADQVEYEFKPRVIRRQVGPARDRSELVMEETSAIASASSSVSSAPNLNGNNKVEAAADRLSAQPAGSGKRPVGQSDNQAAYSEDQNRPPKPNKKPSNRRPTSESYVNNDDEDCNEDYDDDYRQLVNEPMRHFRRMMNSVFGQMSANMPMNPGDAWMRPSQGGNSAFASSSAVNSDDGYSRLSSSVSNNGRMRGIISETRNGRTQTRRIGRDDDEEAEEDVYTNSDKYINDDSE